jgi:hypothetical protein
MPAAAGMVPVEALPPEPSDAELSEYDPPAYDPSSCAPDDPASYVPGFFTAAEYACVEAMAARIIPATETPGAREAGAPAYIDETVQQNPRLHELYRRGLEPFIASGFASLSPADQDVILKQLDVADPFWKSIRALTIDAYYTSEVGLAELGYCGSRYRTEFEGCTHPDHRL